MNELPSESTTVGCSACGTRLRVPSKHFGKEISCPKCDQKLKVPVGKPTSNSQRRSPSSPVVLESVTDLDDDDWLNLDETVPKSRTVTPAPIQRNHEQRVDSTKESPKPVAKPTRQVEDSEFAFVCKTCTAKLHFSLSEVGKPAKCPDCYTLFTVPKPAPNAKLTPAIPKSSSVDSFHLVPSEGKARRDGNYLQHDPLEIMKRAELELRLEKEKSEPILDEAAKNWGRRYFGFVRDGQLCARALLSGIFLSSLGWALHYAATHVSEIGKAGLQFAYFAAFLFLVPFFAYTVAIGFALIDKAANRLVRVREWPPFNPTEWVGEVWMIACVILLAGAPGSLIGYLLMVGLDMSSHIGLGLIGFTIWLVGPHLILGMMDNGSLLKPISVTVVGSLHKCPDAWGAYYFFASIAFATLVGLAIWAEQEMSFPVLIAGMVAPWLIYFIFHQVGVLAESIGEGMAK